MPRFYKKNRKRSKKTYSKSKKSMYSTLNSGGIASKALVKMRYCDQKVMVSTSGTVATLTYVANGIFDPDYTGVGHQPLGHDEYASLYNNYKVISSKISVQSTNTASAPVIVSLNRGDSLTGSTGSMSAICEQPFTKWVQLGGSSGGLSEKTLRMGFVSDKQWPNLKDDDTLRPPFFSTPGEAAYYVLQMQATDAASSASIPVFITIDYIVECTSPKILTQS